MGGGDGWIDRQEKPRLGRSERFTFARNDLGGIKFYESSAIAVTTSPSSTLELSPCRLYAKFYERLDEPWYKLVRKVAKNGKRFTIGDTYQANNRRVRKKKKKEKERPRVPRIVQHS